MRASVVRALRNVSSITILIVFSLGITHSAKADLATTTSSVEVPLGTESSTLKETIIDKEGRSPNLAACTSGLDILSYMAPAGGSQVPNRHCTKGFDCFPYRMFGSKQSGGINSLGAPYQYSNSFYYVLPISGREGTVPGTWTSYEKFGYDRTRIWMARDTHWFEDPLRNVGHVGPRVPGTANGYDLTGTFPNDVWLPDASGVPSHIWVQAGTVSTGYTAKRCMNVYEYVEVLDAYGNPIYPNHNIPVYTKGFSINSDGSWSPSNDPNDSYPWTYQMQLLAAGNTYFGDAVGWRNFIVLQRKWNYAGGSFGDERFWYAQGVGWVGWESFDRNGNRISNQRWGDWEGTSGDALGINLSVDSAFDHVIIRMASQLSNNHLQVFFTTTQENYFSEDKSVELDLNNDGSYRVYDLSLAGNHKWRGTLTGLRIDPADGPGGGCNCLGLVRTRIGNEVRSQYSAYFDITGNGDTQGFSQINLGNSWWTTTQEGWWVWIMAVLGGDPILYRTNLWVGTGR